MGRLKALAAPDRHWLRHVRQVPAGTPGAVQDATFGAWWLASSKDDGLTFLQAQDTLTLGDESQLDLTIPSIDKAGRSAGDRFYFLAGSPDVSPTAAADAIAPYHPGDEFLELYRGRSKLVMSATPYDAQPTVGQVVVNCGDAFRLLRKARETTAGWWCNSPRDAFEHYTRLWRALVSDDFQDAAVQFDGGSGTTPNGLWAYSGAQNGGISYVAIPDDGYIRSTVAWPEGGSDDHSCWRLECTIATAGIVSGSVPIIGLQAVRSDGTPVIQIELTPNGGISIVTLHGGTVTDWPVDTSALFVTGTAPALSPPYGMAIEARDRWLYFYIDGQFVGNAPRPDITGSTLQAQVQCTAMGAGDLIYVDSVVGRRTTAPLNGGDPGDYYLPSPPAAGGLTGEYFDTGSFYAQYGVLSDLFGSPLLTVPGSVFKLGERIDRDLAFGSTLTVPTWPIPPTSLIFGVRWSGAIYLPLDIADIHFQLPAIGDTLDQARLWVGKTRAGEQILTNWDGDTPISTSVGMRSLFGSEPGWYPLVYEWLFMGQLDTGGETTHSDPGFTWDYGGEPVVPGPESLAPLGCFRQQVKNDSHYDTLQTTLAQMFAYQFTCEPRPLESPSFPGVIVPRKRVGRDTDLVMDESIAVDPQPSFIAENVADALLADAQGLGGSSSGGLSLEAFNFIALLQHPFVSSELESIPQTTVAAQLLTSLLTLLGFREAAWEQLQSSVAPIRQKQDTWPLSGELAEFDWAQGDGLRVDLPAVFIEDQIPRQLYTVQRTRTPDGISDAQATFQERIRSPENTLRKFIRQVYGKNRTFQGQIIERESAHVDAPEVVAISLPLNVTSVRKAVVMVVASDGYTGTIVINGVDTGITVSAPGPYFITQLVAKNNGTEPRMLVALTTPAGGTSATYCVLLDVLLPSF